MSTTQRGEASETICLLHLAFAPKFAISSTLVVGLMGKRSLRYRKLKPSRHLSFRISYEVELHILKLDHLSRRLQIIPSHL